MAEFNAFATPAEASHALAVKVAGLLRDAIARHGNASLVLSGGSSPLPFLRELREEAVDWPAVTVLASDERDVPPQHADRNEAMIRRELLTGPAAAARLLPLIPPREVPGRFDAVVLGMGADGHTASLFSGSPDLENALCSAAGLQWLRVPQLEARRISLTPAALLSGGQLFLLFFGEPKRAVFEAALGGGEVAELPVRAVLLQDRVPVSVYWAP